MWLACACRSSARIWWWSTASCKYQQCYKAFWAAATVISVHSNFNAYASIYAGNAVNAWLSTWHVSTYDGHAAASWNAWFVYFVICCCSSLVHFLSVLITICSSGLTESFSAVKSFISHQSGSIELGHSFTMCEVWTSPYQHLSEHAKPQLCMFPVTVVH